MTEENNVIVRYANRLTTHDIAGLSTNAQNLMSLLFAVWTKLPRTTTVIPLDDLKLKLGLTHQTDKYIKDVIASISTEIINKSFVNGEDADGNQIIGYMIYQFKAIKSSNTLEVKTSEDFMRLFEQLLDGYTEYDFLTFYAIQSKQGKNLYRLFRRYYKGTCTVEWDELRLWLGYKPTSQNRNIMQAVKNAIKYLVEQNFLKTCEMAPIYSAGRGNRIMQVRFCYTFPSTRTVDATVPDDKKSPETMLKSSETPPQAIDHTETPTEVDTETKNEPTITDLDSSEPFPAAFNLADIQAKSPEEVSLPDIHDVVSIVSQKSDAKEQKKRLERACPSCGEPMKIRENKQTHELFWYCPQTWGGRCKQKTLTLPADIAEIYWKNKK